MFPGAGTVVVDQDAEPVALLIEKIVLPDAPAPVQKQKINQSEKRFFFLCFLCPEPVLTNHRFHFARRRFE
jgi:hypothetical protein